MNTFARHCVCMYVYMYIYIYIYIYTVVNIWSGSKKYIKVVLRQERILVWGFRTALMKGFDPLQMLTSVYIYIYYISVPLTSEMMAITHLYIHVRIYCLLYTAKHSLCACSLWENAYAV